MSNRRVLVTMGLLYTAASVLFACAPSRDSQHGQPGESTDAEGRESADRTGRVHQLPATPETVAWGYYWSEAEPVLRVEPGDIVEVETVSTSQSEEALGVPAEQIPQSVRDIVEQVDDRGPGVHILTGPIHIEGAEPGDVLEVRILSIDLVVPYGDNGCSGFLPDHCADSYTRIIPLDEERMVGYFTEGVEIPLRPFFGSMGVAPPPEAGRVSSNPPGIHAGNLDNKELVAGTTLFIPVHVAGALFELGDGHAAQGDGEVNQTAIETSLNGTLQFFLHKDRSLDWPRAETPTHFMTMGMAEDLTEAARIAVQQMIELLIEDHGLERADAYALASIAADLRITQIVDGNVGVHMMIPKAIFVPREVPPSGP